MDRSSYALPHTSHFRPSRPLDLVLDDLANTRDPAHHGRDRSVLHRPIRRLRWRNFRKADLGADLATVLTVATSQPIEDTS